MHLAKGYDVVNFFSYFTNLSNIIISVVFIISAVRLVRDRTLVSSADVAIRGAAVVYIVFVGLVFNTLLRDVELGDLMPWVNVVCHFVLPIAGLIDWLVWPPRRRIPIATAFWWLVFPAVYVVYSLIRGAITGFYPYPFFNPAAVGGYAGVALYCAGMLVGFLVLALLIRWAGNALGARRDAKAHAAAS
ncbi:hypothetical protein SAMN04487846_2048 [Microbacterium sp. cf046]|uniref:Pr6Pr family membrane protein n=1 Tax=Microbacterium sp. cf046 TaxID=1761803 RepID=UPI0008EFBCAA|nr:Pr6Pr family membrane protein [Microbacterium sp. cf046]SFS05968.1 hypothetical protein SAMN04487846_2048 [Microbacterium sp. cf046]